MEAYHPHGNHKPKKIKDYLLEFVMIFVAITGGFFMENLREHRVDRHKEKEYIVRLIRDIKEDTAKINSIIKKNQRQLTGLDSLTNLLDKPVNTIDPMVFEDQLRFANNYYGFTPRDITISQLRNSGGLRLIENNSVADSIVDYYSTIDHFCELNVKLNYRYLEDNVKIEMQFIDFYSNTKNSKLNISDTNKLKELKNRCFVFKAQIKWDNVWLKNDVYKKGESLLKNLKNEYHVND